MTDSVLESLLLPRRPPVTPRFLTEIAQLWPFSTAAPSPPIVCIRYEQIINIETVETPPGCSTPLSNRGDPPLPRFRASVNPAGGHGNAPAGIQLRPAEIFQISVRSVMTLRTGCGGGAEEEEEEERLE